MWGRRRSGSSISHVDRLMSNFSSSAHPLVVTQAGSSGTVPGTSPVPSVDSRYQLASLWRSTNASSSFRSALTTERMMPRSRLLSAGMPAHTAQPHPQLELEAGQNVSNVTVTQTSALARVEQSSQTAHSRQLEFKLYAARCSLSHLTRRYQWRGLQVLPVDHRDCDGPLLISTPSDIA